MATFADDMNARRVIGRLIGGALAAVVAVLAACSDGGALVPRNGGRGSEAAEAVRRAFGVQLNVPSGMTVARRGRGFLWLSAEEGVCSNNLCVYALPKSDWVGVGKRFALLRDSVMRLNLPGEAKGMYMQTVHRSLSLQTATVKGQPRLIVRGLWEMHGDAMGGPFVAHMVERGDSLLVAEAFVYAPGRKKRDRMRLLEAALFTLRVQ